MPPLSPAAVRKQIEAGATDPIYLLQGEDEVEKSALAAEFDALVEEGLRAFNVERIHAGEWTTGDRLSEGVAAITAAARTLPMMAPRRVVTVLQAETLLVPKRDSDAAARAHEELAELLERPEKLTTVVFVSAPLDKRKRIWKAMQKHAAIVECGMIEDLAAAQQWIRARMAADGIEIEPAAARLLGELAGFPPVFKDKGPTGDIGRLRGEVERLKLYALGQKKITVDDARQVAGPAAIQDDWALTNAIEAGQTAEALRQLALTLEAGGEPWKILGQIGWMVRSKFPQIAAGDVRAGIDAVFRTDLDIKQSGGDPRVLLERLVVELCAGKRTRGYGGRRY